MESVQRTRPNSVRGRGLSPALPLMVLLLIATLWIACNPFGDNSDPLPDEGATEAPPPDIAEVGLERILEATEKLQTAGDNIISPQPDPSPAPTRIPVPAATPVGAADEARDQVWAYLAQCISINVNELEARQIQGEWFVQAAGKSPDQYGLWKVDPTLGLVRAHNFRARQWQPLIDQNCTPGQFSEFFTPTPSPLENSEVLEATQAVTTLWATLVNCYPNMEIDDLQATLNPARGEWVVTARIDISANYGVWGVASDGTVTPKNRQAQGVFEQLDSGLC